MTVSAAKDLEMAPDPTGERIARLEAGAAATERNIGRLEGKLDEALDKLSTIEISMSRRRGIDGAALWIADTARMLAAGLAGAGASWWIGRH